MAQAFYIENLSESDDESVEPKMKAKRGKGRVYEAFVSMTSSDQAIAKLKSQFAGAYWKRNVTVGDTVWYQCKCCEKKLKLQLIDNSGRCVVSLENDFFNTNHDHQNEEEGQKRFES